MHSFDGFDNITVKPKNKYSKNEVDSLLKEIQLKHYGEVIRMKGFLSLKNGTSIKIDYVLGQIYLTKKEIPFESVLIIIGKELKINELKNIIK
jgi:hypothetical protein